VTSDVYYDPYDVDMYADPYPALRRLREEAPLYYARLEGRVALDEVLTRFPECEVDWEQAKLVQTNTVRGWEALPVVVP
jgi:hypothetical protein